MERGSSNVPKVKNALFTFIAIVVIPLLFFVFLELGLTALGVGKSFDYFHKITSTADLTTRKTLISPTSSILRR